MAAASTLAAVAGGTALLGGIAGAQGNNASSTTTRQVGAESEAGRVGGQMSLDQLKEIEKLLAQGPGAQDVAAGTSSQRSLAQMLQSYSQGGFQPSQADITQSQGLAQQLFQGQQAGLNQTFEEQRVQSSRNAARLGRSAIDPVLQNMLSQGQARQQTQLNANIGAFATDYAQNLPQQRLGFAQQLAQVNSGLATQALSNRQTLLGLGSQLQQQDQNFRLGASGSTTTQGGGGGFQGFLTGALAGGSAGIKAAQGFSGSGIGQG